ncbi:hypothetical protein B2J93_8998 [Marssonina coronariae]|uniref:RRM domain-containing protein n=1 Tax=Diplocarpon coronariae TaxID=2795749 RepID=A0A218ZJZ8_9HELO|nr:hypothetical protein B2J93_8998 [Marssonina coronariae]
MSSPFESQLHTSHHVPGVNLSTFKVPTFPYHSPSSSGEHAPLHSQFPMLSTPYNLQDPPVRQSFVTARVDVLKENDHLRQLNSIQAEEITDLKVSRAAVENDLEHALKDKENALNAIGMVIQSVTRGSSINHAPQSLFSSCASNPSNEDNLIAQKSEIERYKKEVRALKARIQNLERDHEIRGRARQRGDDLGFIGREHNCLRRGNFWGVRVPENSGRAGEVDAVDHSAFSNTPSSQLPQPTQHPEFNPGAADVGMCSLEEFLENDGFPAIISSQSPSIAITQNKSLFEDDRTIDEQLADNAKATALFENMPTPGILKVGFGVEGAIRGKDYDSTPVGQTQPLERTKDWGRPLPDILSSSRDYRGREGRSRQDKLSGFLTEPAFSRNGCLWDNYEDKNGAVKEHMHFSPCSEFRYPEFFKRGVQYVPQDTDSNFMRTIQLSNLPLGTHERDVLARVRGGNILSVTIVSMGKIIPGSVQARVVFKDETAALAYAVYAEHHQISFGDLEDEDRKIAKITLNDTPTYPMASRKVDRVKHQTRCIAVLGVPLSFSLSALDHDLACGSRWRAEGLVEMFIDKDATLHLEFSSIDIAGGAWAVLTTHHTYRRLKCHWEKESCAGDVEELAQNVRSRPPMFPSMWNSRDSSHSGDDNDNRPAEGRRQIAALTNQKVEIPSFSGVKLQSSSWADEVNGDFSETEISPIPGGTPGNVCTSSREVASSHSEFAEAFSVKREKPKGSTSIATLRFKNKTPSVNQITVGEELSAVQIPNINKLGSSAISKPEYPIQDSRKPSIGLAGSNYASSISTFEHDNPRLSPLYSQRTTLAEEKLKLLTDAASTISNDPLRVNLLDLIASPSASTSSLSPASSANTAILHTAVESLSATVANSDTEAENKKQSQLFRWFKARNGKKKRVYSATEHDMEETSYHVRVAQSNPGVLTDNDATEVPGEVVVSNPHEIFLDEDDQDLTRETPVSQASTSLKIESTVHMSDNEGTATADNECGEGEVCW